MFLVDGGFARILSIPISECFDLDDFLTLRSVPCGIILLMPNQDTVTEKRRIIRGNPKRQMNPFDGLRVSD